jgi:hypothetical protein
MGNSPHCAVSRRTGSVSLHVIPASFKALTARKRSQTVPCPPEVLALIERFNEHRDSYLDPYYKETELRRDFIAVGTGIAARPPHRSE